jgi:3-dehydroquinate synthase
MAADMSQELGWIDADLSRRIRELTVRAGLPVDLHNQHSEEDLGKVEYESRLQGLTAQTFLDLMSMDKKVADGQLNLVLLKGPPGTSLITKDYARDKLEKVVKAYCKK